MTPDVTISIPTYKGAQFITETIQSVLAQSLENFEILVFDDGSPDNTREVVAAIDDARISYFRNEKNLGPEGNWNLGLKKARGKYYKLLPHDDLLMPGALSRQVDILEQNETRSIALVFGGRNVIGPNSAEIMSRAVFGRQPKHITSKELINRCVASGTNIIGEPGNGLIRTALLKEIGLYDAREPYTVDLDFWLRVLKYGDAYYTGEIDSAFRLHPQSWSNDLSRTQAKNFSDTIKRFSRDSDLEIAKASQMMGHIRAPINALMRKIFYARYFRA